MLDGANYIVTMDGEKYLCYAHYIYGNTPNDYEKAISSCCSNSLI